MKHKHAELMLEYAKDAMESEKPWENWEFSHVDIRDEWIKCPMNPCWDEDIIYRRKRKTKLINGFEVPYPETVKPASKTEYFTPNTSSSNFYVAYYWANDYADNMVLERGLVYLNKEDAIIRAKSMLVNFE